VKRLLVGFLAGLAAGVIGTYVWMVLDAMGEALQVDVADEYPEIWPALPEVEDANYPNLGSTRL
jgi:hypothetical protein